VRVLPERSPSSHIEQMCFPEEIQRSCGSFVRMAPFRLSRHPLRPAGEIYNVKRPMLLIRFIIGTVSCTHGRYAADKVLILSTIDQKDIADNLTWGFLHNPPKRCTRLYLGYDKDSYHFGALGRSELVRIQVIAPNE